MLDTYHAYNMLAATLTDPVGAVKLCDFKLIQ